MSHRAGWNRVVLAADVRERQLDRITETQFFRKSEGADCRSALTGAQD